MSLPLTVAELQDALGDARPDARVFVLDPDEGAVAGGADVTGLVIRGGDVYLTAPDIAARAGDDA